MPAHIFDKNDVIHRLEAHLCKTFEMIDNKGMFMDVQKFNLQKGIAGAVVEQCIFEYSPDTEQKADLIIIDGMKNTKTELKTTGMVIQKKPRKHFVAKEPMSITAVGVYEIAEQEFETSHFWEKLEHMLIVYYHYASPRPVSAYGYKDFILKGYDFHEFSADEVEILRNDWEYVRNLCAEVVSHHPGPRNKSWKLAVKKEYIETHSDIRRNLNYINLAPKFPPRFRLKKAIVSSMIANHFGYELEQLPERYLSKSEIDAKCREVTNLYAGKSIEELIKHFNLKLKKDTKDNYIGSQV